MSNAKAGEVWGALEAARWTVMLILPSRGGRRRMLMLSSALNTESYAKGKIVRFCRLPFWFRRIA